MKKTFFLVASLTVISAVCAGVLAFVDSVTSEPIAATKKNNTLKAAREVMPEGVSEVVELADGAFAGKDASGALAGFAVKGKDSGGYGGDIELMVGFMSDAKTVVAYKTLSASETPGLGMKLKEESFAGQFKGKDATSLKVKKDGGDIEAITAATITSRAVCRAIADASAAALKLEVK